MPSLQAQPSSISDLSGTSWFWECFSDAARRSFRRNAYVTRYTIVAAFPTLATYLSFNGGLIDAFVES